MKKAVSIIVVSLLVLSMILIAPKTHAAATIWTDKADYIPEDTVIISGSGFSPNIQVTISITRPGSTEDTIYAQTDESGAFTCNYQLDGLTGTYAVTATDGTNTATTTFTDTTPSYDVTISTVNGVWPPPAYIGNPVEFTGTFSANPGAGLEKSYGIQIGWGDGSYTVWRWSDTGNAIPYLTWSPLDGNTKTFSGTYNTNPGSGHPDLGHNYATGGTYTITIKFFHGQPPGAESADAVISISQLVLVPEISVSKSGPTSAHESDTITYTIRVSNPSSSTTMYKVSVVDSVLGTLTGSFSASLAPLASETKTFTYTVPTSSGDITNTVTVTYKDILNDMVTDSASWTVTILHPGVSVSKSGPAYAHDGDTITYTITVSNPSSSTTMYKVSVIDSILGTLTGSFSASLAPLTSETKTFSYNVPKPSADITNTVTVTYKDNLEQQTTNTASWTVDVLHPDIHVTKSGPAYAYECDTIMYTITVTNTGDCKLYAVSVTDTVLGTIWTGDLNTGATMTFTPSYTVPSPSTSVSNTVTATGHDTLGGLKGTASQIASWTVTILHPTVEVTKSGPAYAHEGDAITYTITVLNPSMDTTMYKVSVVDSVLGTLTGSFSASLAPLASETKTFTYTVPTSSGDITNTVTVTYKDNLNQPIINTASWTVDVLHPGISVSKTADRTMAHEGETITYTITVSNTGDCPLHSVSVTDSLLGSIYSNGLDYGATKTFTVTYTVPTPSGDISNTVTASGSDALGLGVSNTASWYVNVVHPGINVVKSGPAYAHEGDTITYTITVSNTGDTTMTKVWVFDSVLGDISGSFSNTLAAGASETKTFSYNVPTPSDDITNTVTVTYKNGLSQPKTDTASWTVDVLHPGISVSKSGPAYAHEGDTITYTITVTNTGDCPLYSVSVTDSLLGPIYNNGLAFGASKTFTVTYKIPSASGDISNTVTASGSDVLGLGVSNTASWFVDVLHPGISVSKSGPAYAHEGDTITYTITVTNTGDCPLYGVFVTDSLLGSIYSNGLFNGETKTFTISCTVPTPSGDISNTVTASGSDVLGLGVSNTASWFVDVLHPGISVSKSGPAYAHEGDTITYTITVTNTGDCPLYGVFVTDSLLGPIYNNGLALGASKTFTVTYTVPSASGDISNTVTACGSDVLGLGVSNTASWTVDVLHPGISVSKTADKTMAHEGDSITYTITVSNTGDCPLYSVSVTDTVLGSIYSNGLGFGVTKTFTVTYVVPSPSGDITNTVTAVGSDVLVRQVSDSASWYVNVVHPGINVVKSGPAYAHEGDTITYTITVSNTGDTTMTKLSVADSVLGDISGSFSNTLAAGASETKTFSYNVPASSDDITNTVTVTYKNGLSQPKIDSGSWTVDVLHPGISVSKTADKTMAHEGETITYRITLTNTGDCPLSSVSVIDSLLGPVYSNGLDYGATKTFTVTYTVPTPSGGISNTVTASGNDALGRQVSDSASWTVNVLHPGIHVTKSGPTYAHEGDTITYTITVTNTGDCPLYGASVADTVLGTIWTGELNTGVTMTFTPTYKIPSLSGDVSNTVTGVGSDIVGLQVTCSASWTVKVQYEITVTASPSGAIGGTFAVTYTQSGTTYTNVLKTTTWTDWADSGTTVTVNNPQDPINDGPGKRYKFDQYNPSASVAMTGSETITLVYKIQYLITFAEIGVGPEFTGTVLTVGSSTSNYGVSGLPVSFWWDDGAVHTFAWLSPLGEPYMWVCTEGLSTCQCDSITVSCSGSITGYYLGLGGWMTDGSFNRIISFDTVWTPVDQSKSTFKLAATNPGQFYYNLFVSPTVTTDSITVTYEIPTDFVLKGADAIQVWTQNGRTGTRISATISGNTITINGPISPSLLYISISLAYSLTGNVYSASEMQSWKSIHCYPATGWGAYAFKASFQDGTSRITLYDPTVVLGL
jgi:uncharacterized repeat protein (TIGR01451 family)